MQKLVRKIEADTKKEVTKIEEEGKQQETEILKQAKDETKKIKDQILDNAKRRAETEHKKIISAAKLSIQREKLNKLEELNKQVLEKVEQNLKDVRNNSNYAENLNNMIQESLEAIQDDKVVILGNAEDLKLVNVNTNKDLEKKMDDSITAGVIITNKDESIRIDNTIETKLKEKWPELKKEVIKNLIE